MNKKTNSELIITAINKNGLVKLVRNRNAKILSFPLLPRTNYFTVC